MGASRITFAILAAAWTIVLIGLLYGLANTGFGNANAPLIASLLAAALGSLGAVLCWRGLRLGVYLYSAAMILIIVKTIAVGAEGTLGNFGFILLLLLFLAAALNSWKTLR